MAGDTDPTRVAAKLRGLRAFLLLYAATWSWLWLLLGPGDPGPGVPGLALSASALTACFAASLVPRWATWAPRLALPIVLLQIGQTLPLTHNHLFLELFALGLVAIVDGDGGEDGALALRALQWMTALVLFHTGLQKVLHGLYFHGEFLAFMVGQGERFATPFQVLLPTAEVARLQGYDTLRTGAGPFRVDSLPFVLMSNAVWIAEIALAPLLIVRRTRTLAAAAAGTLVLAIQLGAREVGFALLFVNLLLLFPRRGSGLWLLPLWAGLALLALGLASGLLPWSFLLEGVNP